MHRADVGLLRKGEWLMNSAYLGKLLDIGHRLLPAIRENRPLTYWHFKTCLVQAVNGDFSAARDLAELVAEVIDESISSCLEKGEHSRADVLRNARENIMEGIK